MFRCKRCDTGLRQVRPVDAAALIQRGRAEGGAGRADEAQAGGQQIAGGQGAGVDAAELTVVVMPCVGLQAQRTGAPQIAECQRVLVALVGAAGSGQAAVLQLVFTALQHEIQLLRFAEFIRAVQADIAQLGFGLVGRRFGLVALGRLAHRQLRLQRGQPRGGPVGAGGLGVLKAVVVDQGLRFGAVVLAVHMALQRHHFDAVRSIQLRAEANAGVVVAITVTVGHVAEAAGQVERGVETIAALGRGRHGVVKNPAAAGHAAVELLRAQIADGRAQVKAQSAAALAREDLHHAADGVRAVDRAGRAFQHLDALDLRQRQCLPAGAAGGLRIDPHAVDQHQRVAGVGAAQVQGGGRCRSAVAGHLGAAVVAQQVGDAAERLALDVGAGQHGHVSQHVRQLLGRAGGGDEDRIELVLAGAGLGRGCGNGRQNGGRNERQACSTRNI